MTSKELSELERARRRALWALASLHPGDSMALGVLAILDDLDDQERSSTAFVHEPLDLNKIRHSAPVKRHHSGTDIVLEQEIPQPWRERFLQASVGSTRLPEGPYAHDWQKFLVEWEREMQHLQNHRVAQTLAAIAIDRHS
ncbi:hypothetical protein F7R08_02320 [Pseudomonas extremorientalis]|uniref:Uncharacterized protein n=1 Tax=Pseudomonas extremorientalis TaxID=169669 RepID=A0A1S2TN20_9PSED|nr:MULTISPECIES: hypothetical protein [Pseudomonas]KAB0522028.1 hypothetical protein F7R08_02320 [Pseudomonas extremorientalis]OIN10789.1 hypothetical protein BFN10_08855 [Pseudomonas extremorientalis]